MEAGGSPRRASQILSGRNNQGVWRRKSVSTSHIDYVVIYERYSQLEKAKAQCSAFKSTASKSRLYKGDQNRVSLSFRSGSKRD
jgi:hypothetical protein